MHVNTTALALTIAAATLAAAGCARKEGGQAAAPAETARSAPAAAEPAPEPAPSEATTREGLVGTSWRLVRIMSMDDTTYTPQDPSLFALEFLADGSMRVKADCNVGTGSWTSESPGQLRFGVLAATQAECAPDSLHDRYMAQFEWVRSYLIENGHLFLATMADGSIIEFEPAPSAAHPQ